MKVEEGIVAVETAPKRRLSLVFIALVIGLGLGFWGGRQVADYGDRLDYAQLDEVYKVLDANYDGEIDTAKLIDGAKKGMVAGLEDPYTQYFSRIDAQEFNEDLEGEFTGVGIELNNKDGNLIIVDVLDNTPAEQAGLKAGDAILKVDETDVAAWASEEAVKIIRGEADTKVRLTIARDAAVQEFDITRSKINNPSVKYQVKDGVGILSVLRFGETDTARLAKYAAEEFVKQKVRGVVLDLRGNGGGYVSAAVDLASLWIDKGQVITTEKVGQITSDSELAVGGNILKGYQTVVLIDGGSASASEIVAGALKDYNLAVIVGSQSFGKGSVQTMQPLRNGDQLKITIARWYTPNDNNIDNAGISPDETVEFDSEAYKNGVDNQLNKALELLKK
ncbi:MAG: S41 family peptidase [Candidatus Nomurabacteria bacterium]|jgi:carboxyl-terminal processing protease|nr:S41 family peptidase [Candidatus Nomurabacteria bacterium]